MKSRPSSKNSASIGLLSLCLWSSLILGCSSSTSPTFIKEDIPSSIESICKKEYDIDVRARLVGKTLWLYLPVEDMFEKSDKPEKFTEKFSIENDSVKFSAGSLKVEYLIQAVPDKEKQQEYKYNKDVLEKNQKLWRALRRVIFSMGSSGEEPEFFVTVTADVKNGFETKEVFYILDLKKVSYEFISWTEYQHRAISDMDISHEIIADTDGNHLDYKDMTLEEFLGMQIQQRIKLKFQKPEVEKGADIDKEVMKIVAYTFNTYGFKDFSSVELSNLATNSLTVLNQAAVLSRPID